MMPGRLEAGNTRILTMPDRRGIALAQGMYFVATGVWPLVHMQSFEAVTGPKVDKWLVRTVGLLVGVIGGVLVSAAARNRVTPEVAALGVSSAVALGAIDTFYASRGRIEPIYLADAALEAVLAVGWGTSSSGSTARRSMSRAF
jgi:hypothetical protein